MGFSKHEHWSRLPCSPPGDLTNPGIESKSICLLHWQVSSLPLAPPGKPWLIVGTHSIFTHKYWTDYCFQYFAWLWQYLCNQDVAHDAFRRLEPGLSLCVSFIILPPPRFCNRAFKSLAFPPSSVLAANTLYIRTFRTFWYTEAWFLWVPKLLPGRLSLHEVPSLIQLWFRRWSKSTQMVVASFVISIFIIILCSGNTEWTLLFWVYSYPAAQ